MNMTQDEALHTATRIVEGAMATVYRDTDGRLLDLEIVAYATAQAVRHGASDRFGPGHAMTAAFREIADKAAMRAFEHTSQRIAESLSPVEAGEALRDIPQ